MERFKTEKILNHPQINLQMQCNFSLNSNAISWGRVVFENCQTDFESCLKDNAWEKILKKQNNNLELMLSCIKIYLII